ncbi:hypothetical protein PRIPAC_77251 [Pristionchus pacificus]|uniref:Uncharacterized protein n=1 Tax=Pristionchus pacificus TaxID=54126 RepID=A0A2A6BWQ2_PRIPA|nr:hypothetical protein PRIPAC_77251 [Pristionchus pacificus]|eukprot:PDM70308.1 hypothetical protein PRIPAC_46554 [Pristionchus pacificus]
MSDYIPIDNIPAVQKLMFSTPTPAEGDPLRDIRVRAYVPSNMAGLFELRVNRLIAIEGESMYSLTCASVEMARFLARDVIGTHTSPDTAFARLEEVIFDNRGVNDARISKILRGRTFAKLCMFADDLQDGHIKYMKRLVRRHSVQELILSVMDAGLADPKHSASWPHAYAPSTSNSLIDTAINECYHSLSLMYAAKRFACSPHYYKLKMRVSMMHYNSLMLDDILGRRKEIGNTMITRKGRIVIAIKRKRSPGTHTWREEVMEESIKAREETSAMRQLRLIGIPEDDVFDEMKNWWEEQNRMALESGYELEPGEEMGEDEEWDEYDDEPSHEY